MKKILLFLFGLILTSSVIGQTVAGYSFSQPAGAWSAIAGGTVLGTGTMDDNTYNANNIGFNFTFRGVVYTQFSACANGFIGLGPLVYSSYAAISNASSGAGYTDLICAANNDLQGQLTAELRFQTLGSAPNRTCVIQFLHFGQYGYSGSGAGADWSFQIILYETTNLVDIVYGPFIANANTQTEQVGLRGASNADYKNRTTATNWSATTAGGANSATCTMLNTCFPVSGLTFRFTPPPPCVTPLAQPTTLLLTPGVNNIMASFTASASADQYLVVRSTSAVLGATPVNGTVYIAGAAFGSGIVEYWGANTYFTSIGLIANTRYYYYIFAANNAACVGGPIYLTPSPLIGNILTLAAPANICGTKTVGATGADYVNLSAAMFALSNSLMTCPVTILLNANYSSAGEFWPLVVPNVLGSSVTNTLTIKPNTGVTASISGPVNAGMVLKVLNSNTIIDGSNTIGGTTQNLTIANTSVTTPQVLVVGSTGTTPITNCTIKNTIFINGVNTSSAVIISDGTAPGAAGYFNNITFQNNSIQQAYIGLYCISVVAAGNGSGTLITGNQINSAGANSIRLCPVYVQGVDGATVSNNSLGNMTNTIDAGNITGIWFATSTVNSTISGNTISNISGSAGGPRGIAVSSGVTAANITISGNTITNLTTASSGNCMGIYFFSTTTGCNITKNLISNIKNTSAGGWLATAMYLASTAVVNANCNVVNNSIWDVAGYGYSSYAWNGNGIVIYSGFGYNLYFNTVNMNTEQTSATGMPSALFIYSSITTVGAIDLRNNIFNNTQTIGTNRYAIYSLAANTVFSNIDYNDYFTTGPNLGYIASTNQATLANIQTSFGGNLNSQNINPTIVVPNIPTNVALQRKGLYMAAVPTDITGVGRTDPPDVGAYQFSSIHTVITTAASNLTTTTATINGSITANNLSVASGFDWGLTTAYTGGSVTGTPLTVSGNTATAISANLAGLTVNNIYHYRASGTNGGLTVYGSDLTFSTTVPPTISTVAAAPVGATFATLNGSVNPKNASTVVSFEYGLNTLYGTPVAVGTYTGNTDQPFFVSVTGLTINQTYHFRAKAVNPVTGSPFYGADMTFFTTCVVPPTPGAISGPPNVCKTGTGYVYSVTEVPYGFYYNWTYPAGFNPTSYIHSNTITFSITNAAVSGTITVQAVSDCGAPSPFSTMAVAVNSLPLPIVTGNSPVCQYIGNSYNTQPGQSAYVWTALPDGTVTPTANPEVVSITWANSGAKTVAVIYTNPATGCTAAAPGGTLPVSVTAAPTPIITGNNNMCMNSGYYDYLTQTGNTAYVWNVSPGGTITSGQNTAAAQVVWNTPGAQWVSVNFNGTGGCSAPSATVFNVTVNGMPGSAGSISGSSSVCPGSLGVPYSVPPIPNSIAYVWTLPVGVNIASGAGTNSITVDFSPSAVSGDITVYGNSLCGSGGVSPAFNVTITPLPLAAGPVLGLNEVCAGEMGVSYSVLPVANATGYVWNLPAGATIASGANTSNITVDFAFGAVSGNVSVYGTNACGNGLVSPNLAVVVKPVPETPVIINYGDTLYSNTQDGNQWYYEGAPIVTGTGQILVAHYTGWYWDAVIKNGCISDTSNHIHIIVTGINEPDASSFVVSPVPNDGQFKLMMNTPAAESFDISISNAIGATVYKKENVLVNGPATLVIDLRPISAGVYTMIIRNGNNKVVRKIVVNK